MQILFDVSLPIFAIILCGVLAGKYKVIEQSGAKSLNNYIYYFALPALLFLSLAKAPLSQLANGPFIWASLGGIFCSFLLAMVLARTLLKQSLPTLALSGMAASYGTTSYIGIPVALAAFGPAAALPASFAAILHNIPAITVVTLTFALPSSTSHTHLRSEGQFPKRGTRTRRSIAHVRLVPLEQARWLDCGRPYAHADWYQTSLGEQEPTWRFLRPLMHNILLNPLNIAVALGISVAFFHLPLPQSVTTFAQLLANSSGPVGLFVIGLSLYGQRYMLHKSEGNRLGITITVLLKILLQPFITLLLMLFIFHGQGLWATVAIFMSALPIGTTVYVFAQRYGQLMEQTIVAILVSMIVSVFTISALLIFLTNQG